MVKSRSDTAETGSAFDCTNAARIPSRMLTPTFLVGPDVIGALWPQRAHGDGACLALGGVRTTCPLPFTSAIFASAARASYGRGQPRLPMASRPATFSTSPAFPAPDDNLEMLHGVDKILLKPGA
eukprot:gene11239-biopygen3559